MIILIFEGIGFSLLFKEKLKDIKGVIRSTC